MLNKYFYYYYYYLSETTLEQFFCRRINLLFRKMQFWGDRHLDPGCNIPGGVPASASGGGSSSLTMSSSLDSSFFACFDLLMGGILFQSQTRKHGTQLRDWHKSLKQVQYVLFCLRNGQWRLINHKFLFYS